MNHFFINLKLQLFILLFSVAISILARENVDINSNNDIIGMWQTTLTESGTEIIIIFDIKHTESDSLQCLIHLPEFGFSNVPYGNFVIQAGIFSLPGFEAKYNQAKEEITGRFSAMGPDLEITLSRIDKKPIFNVDCPEKEPSWSFKTEEAIWSSPTIDSGNIIFGNDQGKLYSINIENKSPNWIFECAAPIRSKALVYKGIVYFTSDDGNLYSLQCNTGEKIWVAYIGNDVSKRMIPASDEGSFDYLCSSPSIHEDKLYIGSMDSCIYALDIQNGSIIWKFKTHGIIRSTPEINNQIVYIGSWDNFLYAINANDGNLLWKYDAGGPIQSSPEIMEDKVIFGSRSAFIFALDKKTGDEIWKIRYWGSWVESSPVQYNGLLYIGSSDYRKIHAIDPDTGIVQWGTLVGGWTWLTPAVNDKYVYTGSIGSSHSMGKMHGRFYAIDRETGDYIWQFKVNDDSEEFAYGIAASPVLWNDWVFFGGIDGSMYGVKEK